MGGDIEYAGFINQDSYTYRLYQNFPNSISATDRLDQLFDIAYAKADNTFYSGRETLIGIFSKCFDSTGLDLVFATHMNWYPHLSSNNLSSSDYILISIAYVWLFGILIWARIRFRDL